MLQPPPHCRLEVLSHASLPTTDDPFTGVVHWSCTTHDTQALSVCAGQRDFSKRCRQAKPSQWQVCALHRVFLGCRKPGSCSRNDREIYDRTKSDTKARRISCVPRSFFDFEWRIRLAAVLSCFVSFGRPLRREVCLAI